VRVPNVIEHRGFQQLTCGSPEGGVEAEHAIEEPHEGWVAGVILLFEVYFRILLLVLANEAFLLF